MGTRNLKHLTKSIYLIAIIGATLTGNAFANKGDKNFVTGKVIYSDNQCPVTEGNIKVFNSSESGSQEAILEITNIQSNGEFKISSHSIELMDGIKIMAYPNDADNPTIFFEPQILDINKALKNSNDQYSLIIQVQRVKSNSTKSIKNKASENAGLLKQNFPNPFNPTTVISFDLQFTSKVTLKVYNMSGEAVSTILDNKTMDKGMNEIVFNASDLPSGIYVYSLKTGSYSENKKIILLK